MCQISSQDSEVTKSKNQIGIFRSKSFVFVVLIGAVGFCRNICFKEGFIFNRNFNNCDAMLTENSLNPLKAET